MLRRQEALIHWSNEWLVCTSLRLKSYVELNNQFRHYCLTPIKKFNRMVIELPLILRRLFFWKNNTVRFELQTSIKDAIKKFVRLPIPVIQSRILSLVFPLN